MALSFPGDIDVGLGGKGGATLGIFLLKTSAGDKEVRL